MIWIQLLCLLCTIGQAKIFSDSVNSTMVTVRNGSPTAQGIFYSNFTINDRTIIQDDQTDIHKEISNNVYLTDQLVDGDVVCMYSCANQMCRLFRYTYGYIEFASDVPQKEVTLEQDPWIAMQVDLENTHAGSTYQLVTKKVEGNALCSENSRGCFMDEKLSQYTHNNKDLTCVVKDDFVYESTLTATEKA